MEVTVDITPDDYWHFNKLYMRRRLLAKKQPWYLLLILGGVALILAVLLSVLRGDVAWVSELARSWVGSILGILLLLAGLCVVLLVAVFFMTRRMVKKQGATDAGVTGEHHIRIDAEGIHEKTADSEGFHKWTAVTEVSQDTDYVFLFLAEGRAHIVPKRAFTDAQETSRFFKTSVDLWKACER